MKFNQAWGNWAEKISRWLLWAILAVALVVMAWYQTRSLLFRYPIDYGEAATVDISMRMLRGVSIYPVDLTKPDYIISNYPPLYMALQAPLIGLFGPGFWQGRLISIICTWVAAYFLALTLHHHTKDVFASAVTGMIFLAWPFVVMWSGLARIDCLALALALAGLFFLSRADMKWSHFWLGSLLLVGAIFTRQSYMLAIPAAAFFWLLFREWRKALLLVVTVGGLSLLIFLVLNSVTHGGFFLHSITLNLNTFNIEQLKYQLRNNLFNLAWPLLLMAAASLFLILKGVKFNRLVGAFLIGAGLSALTIGKVGSNYNYFLELCAALSLSAGSLLAWIRKYQGQKLVQSIILMALVVQTGIFLNRTFEQQIPRLQSRLTIAGDLQKLEGIVASSDGIVLADEYMGLISLQNKLLYIQPFASTQAAYDGLWDETDFVNSIQAKKFSLILIYGTPGTTIIHSRWTDQMLAAIEGNYTVTETIASTRIFTPNK